jgi:predicted outer membrane repeat protein
MHQVSQPAKLLIVRVEVGPRVVGALLKGECMKARANTLLAEARRYLLFRVGVLATLTLLLTFLCASTVWAATFTVTNTSDSGSGSLRAAIEQANANAGADKIVFADGVSGTITLASTLPEITDTAGLAINAGGDITVSGNHAVGVFEVGSNNFGEVKLALRNLTIADGAGVGLGLGSFGGGIYNGGTLEVVNVTFSGNSAKYGGAIYTSGFGKSTVTNSTFSGNSAGSIGGGIYNSSFSDFKSTVTNSTFSGNSASNSGGGIANSGLLEVTNTTISGNSAGFGGGIDNSGPLKVTNSTFSNNSAINGGGIYNREGPLGVANSTFFDNSASNSGGGVYNSDTFAKFTVTNSTFSGNSADEGGGIYNNGTVALATLSNTILANSLSGGNCLGFPVTDGGYNIDSGTSCGFTQATGSLSNTNPRLDPAGLQDNGGPTQTIALQPDSPAVDLVGQGACPPPTTDQRGVERPQEEACDSGAFELVQQPTPDTTPPKVVSTSPKANAAEVAPTANVRATFSEDMDSNTINGTTFKLFKKGTSTQIAATVNYNAGTDTAKLNPTKNLRRGVVYRAVVTTGAKDVAGNRLDQHSFIRGLQKKWWFFRVAD